MRILHVLADTIEGGAQRVVVHLLRQMEQKPHSAGVVSLRGVRHSGVEAALAQARVPVFYLDKRPGLDVRLYDKLDDVFRRFKPEILHTHRLVLQYTAPVAIRRRIPVCVHTVHSVIQGSVNRSNRWVQAVAFRGRVHPVAVAGEIKASVERAYRVRNVTLIPNGIPVADYASRTAERIAWRLRHQIDPDAVVFVCVARLNYPKNQALLIEAFASGPAQDPAAHLLLVGDGPDRQRLEGMVDQHNLGLQVHFLGNRADVQDILAASDVFVLSSEWEGNPLSIMEAMAAGKPVISTAVGGIPELVVPGTSGLLVPNRDAGALREAMVSLLQQPRERDRLGEGAARHAETYFDVRRMAAQYERLYEALMSREQVAEAE